MGDARAVLGIELKRAAEAGDIRPAMLIAGSVEEVVVAAMVAHSAALVAENERLRKFVRDMASRSYAAHLAARTALENDNG